MDVGRISSGEQLDERGVPYSGKIKRLMREISEIEDVGRYKYHVTIIANTPEISNNLLRNLAGGFPVEIFNADRCFSELVFPVLTGTYFQKENLGILIDLSNKNAGAKISYEVTTAQGSCDITVLFVPTLEIARTMFKYKNAILKYNPRSYLEFAGQAVNNSIRETIIANAYNEFALLNNGITMLSDETSINEKIGQKNKAQLFLRNPQIINGGQTAYTLSRIYEEQHKNSDAIFSGKEVLLKVITLTTTAQPSDQTNLIDRISTATNQQTAVTNSDRHSNDEDFLELQKSIFERYGILFERKRGEFSDGVRDGYLTRDQILDRNAFAKIYFAANDELDEAVSRRAILKIRDASQIAADNSRLDHFCFGYYTYKALGRPSLQKANVGAVAKISLFTKLYYSDDLSQAERIANENIMAFNLKWDELLKDANLKKKKLVRHYQQNGQVYYDHFMKPTESNAQP